MDPRRIQALETWVQASLQPDLTLIFDLPVETARERLKVAGAELDRFEQQDREFFNRVRKVYLERAKAMSFRIKVINSDNSVDNIRDELEKMILSI